ncbi:RNA polymerase sigma factor [Tundrisphaera lichenicola]|uniref:RNA polymerase sigma factor n=1 Tax=Tundrisphaera lichenicola TaxID=2029860 RepID=UPI003EBE4F02
MLDLDPPPDDLERRLSDLLAMLIRMGFPFAVAQDAVQAAMLKDQEWLADGRASVIKNRPAWIRTVAIRAAQAEMRRRRRERALDLGAEPAIIPFPALDQEEEDRQRLNAIHAALGRLPEELRTVLLMHTIGGRTIRGIAGDLGVAFGAANHRLTRARQIVRDELRAQGFELPESA